MILNVSGFDLDPGLFLIIGPGLGDGLTLFKPNFGLISGIPDLKITFKGYNCESFSWQFSWFWSLTWSGSESVMWDQFSTHFSMAWSLSRFSSE